LPRQPGLFAPAILGRTDGAGSPSSTSQEASETHLEDWIFRADYGQRLLTEQFGVAHLEGFGLAAHPQAIAAAGALVHYLRETSARPDAKLEAKPEGSSASALLHLDTIRYYEQQDSLVLDPVTVRNLELLSGLNGDENHRSGRPDASLFGAIDQTVTVMGARLLRAWILRPELSRPEIEARL